MSPISTQEADAGVANCEDIRCGSVPAKGGWENPYLA